MQTPNTDLIQNAIEQIKTICLALMDDLEYYNKRPKPNLAYIDIHQKRIDTLFDVCQMFTQVYNQIEENTLNVNMAQHVLTDKVFKLEACLVYHGVSLAEMQQFTARDSALVAQDVKTCLAENWRQMPIVFRNLMIDKPPNAGPVSKDWIKLRKIA